jgi:flagellar biosynthesis protein FliP
MDTNQVLNTIAVDDKIFIIRGIQVMVDRDLAELYQVSTSRLNEQVKRNSEKFPSDFMFELTDNEKNELIAKCDNLQKLKFNPSKVKVFTIMRTFVRLKNQFVPYFEIIKRLEKLETNDKETRELLQKVVQVVSSMQDIQDEAKEGTKKIGFV